MEYKTDTKLLVIAGVRTEDLLAESPLIQLFGELGGKGKITEILLNRLDQEATYQLASDLWGEIYPDSDVQALNNILLLLDRAAEFGTGIGRLL